MRNRFLVIALLFAAALSIFAGIWILSLPQEKLSQQGGTTLARINGLASDQRVLWRGFVVTDYGTISIKKISPLPWSSCSDYEYSGPWLYDVAARKDASTLNHVRIVLEYDYDFKQTEIGWVDEQSLRPRGWMAEEQIPVDGKP